MRPQLHAVIEEAYEVFSDYRVRHSLSVCHCNCCMTEEDERRLLKTALRDIPADLLAEYTNSAHSWDDGPVAREMRYFLPRYFELLAIDDPPDNGGVDICLRRLGYANWRAKWPDRECDVIDRFFDEYMRSSLERTDLVLWPVGWRLAFDLSDVLTLVVTAHGDLQRALAGGKRPTTLAPPSTWRHCASVCCSRRIANTFIPPIWRIIARRLTLSARSSCDPR